MCRIDAPFGNLTLNEKNDPNERFLQALDEYEIEGQFRTLLIKHFSEHWGGVFRNTSRLEETLNATKVQDSEFQKCIVILLSQKQTLTLSILRYLKYYPVPVHDNSLYGFLHDQALISFLDDVAQTYYPSSPYGLFIGGMNKIQENYSLFLRWFYGNDFCFSKPFFDDESLNALHTHDRASELWKYFHSISPTLQSRGFDLFEKELLTEFTFIASSNYIYGPPTKGSSEILRGIEFIKTWLFFDSQAGRLSFEFYEFFNGYESFWPKLEVLFERERNDDINVTDARVQWLKDKEYELKHTYYVNANLEGASDSEIEQWADGCDAYIYSYAIHDYKSYDYISNDYEFGHELTLAVHLNNTRYEFYSQLTPLQIENLIRYVVKKDFDYILSSNRSSSLHFNRSEGFVNEKYFEIWQKLFFKIFNDLEFEVQLRILTPYYPCAIEGASNEFLINLLDWWNGLFSSLIEKDNFPKKLTSDWAIIAIDKFPNEELLPYIDKSIGVLRGELLQDNNSDETIHKYNKQLKKLLEKIDNKQLSKKSLRHRMLLMRSSKEPLSDTSVSTFDSLNHETRWYSPLEKLASSHISNSKDCPSTIVNYSQTQIDYFIIFSQELAEFCLSRLQLRKGEKTVDEKYKSEQIIESSAIWRQGYLKALTELGIDLNVKVHKTVNFTKKSDPDKNVRDMAGECYKAVRRKTTKNPSIQDLKRGIISAEWWLLLCQRKELGLEINHDEALKTRRRLLRNP